MRWLDRLFARKDKAERMEELRRRVRDLI